MKTRMLYLVSMLGAFGSAHGAPERNRVTSGNVTATIIRVDIAQPGSTFTNVFGINDYLGFVYGDFTQPIELFHMSEGQTLTQTAIDSGQFISVGPELFLPQNPNSSPPPFYIGFRTRTDFGAHEPYYGWIFGQYQYSTNPSFSSASFTIIDSAVEYSLPGITVGSFQAIPEPSTYGGYSRHLRNKVIAKIPFKE